MHSISFLQSKIAIRLGRELYEGTCFKNRLFVFQSFHTNMSLPHRTSWITTIKKDDFFSLISQRNMAGHSKWQNIKHIKEAKDRQKNLTCNKYVFLIGMAIREGGPDPKSNNKLATLLETAKKNNVPSSTVENALKRSSNRKTKSGSMEILGPGGCVLIVEFETDNVSVMRHEIKVACKKYSANILVGEGRWRAAYEQKGIIKITGQKNGQPLDAEKALDSAIEAGAEEVQTKEDEDGNSFLEFLCAAEDLHPVKKELERVYVVEEGYVGYLPILTVPMDKEVMTLFENLLEDLGNMPDVIRIYENAQ